MTSIATAHGRANLIGEHTDYSGGLVLPIATPQSTRVVVVPRTDRTVRATSRDVDAGRPFSFELGTEQRSGTWADYVQGTVTALRAAGHDVGGFDLEVASDVPVGAGLASSAALEVSLLRALRAAFALPLSDADVANVARAAETDFVGVPVGIMDPMAASFADETSALFLDTRSLAFERIAIPPGVSLLVIDSGVAHGHAGGAYATRRAECVRAAALLGARELRDVEDVAATASLPDPLRRRARHVVTENARVVEATACLRRGDVVRLGEILREGHASLRDDFEVSVEEVDRLVAIADAHPRVLGARMTGGGFGGAIVALARVDEEDDRAAAAVVRSVADAIASAYGGRGRVLVPEGPPAAGG